MIKLKDIINEAKIKHIDIWFEDSRGRFYRTVIDGKKRVPGWDSWRAAQDSLSKLLGYTIYLRTMDDRALEKAAKELLEFNNRREGPILEGDERFFFKTVEALPDNQESSWDIGVVPLMNKSVKHMLAKQVNTIIIYKGEETYE